MLQISPLWEQIPAQSLQPMPLRPLRAFAPSETDEQTVREPASFTDIFQEAVNAVKETDAEKTELEYLMGTGQLDNPALLTIASTKAQLSVQLLVSLRDKCVQSYQELMRINL